MSRKRQNRVRRILALREQIKTADEALTAHLAELAAEWQPGDSVTVDGKTYELREAFADGPATWRPARVHRWSLTEKRA